MGYLTGKIDANTRLDPKTDLRAGFDRFSLKTSQQICRWLICSNDLQKRRMQPSQIALAWLMAQKPFVVSIPGTRNMDHLNETLGAINVQPTAADLSELATALSNITVHGGRMNEMQMQAVDQTV